MTGHDPTTIDDRLRTVAAWVARTTVEVERGLRPIDHLRTLAHPGDRRPARVICQLRTDLGGPVTIDQVGTPILSRIGTDKLYASVPTRTADGRTAGLTMQLFRDDNRWYLADVQRLANRRSPETRTAPDPPAWRRLELLESNHRVVSAAHRAAVGHLAELEPGDRGYRHVRDAATSFGRIAGRLEREHAELTATLALRHQLGLTEGRTR